MMIILRFTRRTLRSVTLIITLLLLTAIGFALGGGFNRTLSAVSHVVSVKPIYAVDTDQKVLAISFDASWGAENTTEILDILDEYKIKTTFFLVNIWMQDYPDKAKEIVARGHEIGLHSTTHPSFTTLSEEQMRSELSQNDEMIRSFTGKAPTLFRPPFGDYNDQVVQVAQSMGYEVIQWSVDSLDWKKLSAEEISERIMNGAANGAIILLHNDGENTPEALRIFLPKLKEEGYDIVPISDLIYNDNYYVDYNGIQRSQAPS